MKSAIIYYSYSGNTKKVADIFAELLRSRGKVDVVRLIAPNENDSFMGQARRAFFHKRTEIIPVNFDLSRYDLVCLGTPVWAFGPAPAVNTYLDRCTGVTGKKVILFTTYGSGVGRERCVDYMQAVLARKGAKDFSRFSVQQSMVNDRRFVLSQIRKEKTED